MELIVSDHSEIIANLRKNLSEDMAAQRKAQATIDQVREDCLLGKRDPSPAESRKVEEAKRTRDEMRESVEVKAERIAELERDMASDAAAREMAHMAERGSYEQHFRIGQDRSGVYTEERSRSGELSFFQDLWQAEINHDQLARQRVDQFTARAQSTGAAAGLVIPNYLLEQVALVVRAGRPTANVVQHQELPDGGMSLIIPQGVIGSSAASQATENSAVSNTDATWNPLTVPIVTIAGQLDVSRQLLERGGQGVDLILARDLALAYAAEVDRQVLDGLGTGNTMLGIGRTAGIGQATAFTAAATTTTFYAKLAGAINQVASSRGLPPTHVVMHPRRLAWLLSQVDTQGRPLVVPDGGGINAFGTGDGSVAINPEGVTGLKLMGLQVVTDVNVPTSVGTGPEDVVFVIRAEDAILWENGDGMPVSLRFDQTLGNQLTSKIVVYGYAGFTAARYPQAFARVGGNSAAGYGLIAPTF